MSLHSICPLDGRYRKEVSELPDCFSEFAWIKTRVTIEINWFLYFVKTIHSIRSKFDWSKRDALEKLYMDFSEEDAEAIKEIEKTTNHDVKAVEYWLREAFIRLGIEDYSQYIHIGITSQDTSPIPYLLGYNWADTIEPQIKDIISLLSDTPKIQMLGFTHGQPATPTTLHHQISVFEKRLNNLISPIVYLSYKFAGSVGGYIALKDSYPETDWEYKLSYFNGYPSFVDGVIFINSGGHDATTQIDHYDHIAAYFDRISRISTVLLDLCQDMWLYISKGYFEINMKEGEIGSSTIPQKANPIDFERAEGNIHLGRALLNALSNNLPVSRLQRDLSDSTMLRSSGVAIGYILLAIKSVKAGLKKVKVNKKAILADLHSHPEAYLEIFQTRLRAAGVANAYELIREFSIEYKKGIDHGKATCLMTGYWDNMGRGGYNDLYPALIFFLETRIDKDKLVKFSKGI